MAKFKYIENCIDNMRKFYGDQVVYDYCLCNVYKCLYSLKFDNIDVEKIKAEMQFYIDYSRKLNDNNTIERWHYERKD